MPTDKLYDYAKPYDYYEACRLLGDILGDLEILAGNAVGPADATWQDVAGTLSTNLRILAIRVGAARRGLVAHPPVVFPGIADAGDQLPGAQLEAATPEPFLKLCACGAVVGTYPSADAAAAAIACPACVEGLRQRLRGVDGSDPAGAFSLDRSNCVVFNPNKRIPK